MSKLSPIPVSIPRLETDRLILRGHCLDDFPGCLALWGDQNVTRFIGGRPSSTEEVWARLHRYLGHWALLGFGYWALIDKDSGALIGEAGFADFKRVITPAFNGAPECGWALMPAFHGKGLAFEALQAMHHWADAHFDARESVCMIAPENEASIRLASRLGYVEFARTLYKDSPTILHRRQV